MIGVWGVVGPTVGALALLLSGIFAARATKSAAATTAEAQRMSALAAAEPAQRERDLEAFREVKVDLQQQVTELREETRSLRGLVRSFAWYVSELTLQMRGAGIEPPAPPSRIDEYNRTGV